MKIQKYIEGFILAFLVGIPLAIAGIGGNTTGSGNATGLTFSNGTVPISGVAPTGSGCLVTTASGISVGACSSGSGTVTSVSGVNANGFSWSIANSTTTPTLTLSVSGTIPINISGVAGSATNVNGGASGQAVIQTGTSTTGFLGYSSAPTSSYLASRDANGSSSFTNVFLGSTSTATSGQTITMTYGSAYQQLATGASSIKFNLPDATYLTIGARYLFTNNSTGILSLYLNDGTTLLTTTLAGSVLDVTLSNNSTTNGVWNFAYHFPTGATAGTSGIQLNTGSITIGGGGSGTIGSTGLSGKMVVDVDTGNPYVVEQALRRSDSTASLGASSYCGKQRGTLAIPASVVNGDTLCTNYEYGYDGSNYQYAAAKIVTVGGTSSSGVVPGAVTYQTSNASGVLTTYMSVNASQAVTFASSVSVGGTLNTSTITGSPTIATPAIVWAEQAYAASTVLPASAVSSTMLNNQGQTATVVLTLPLAASSVGANFIYSVASSVSATMKIQPNAADKFYFDSNAVAAAGSGVISANPQTVGDAIEFSVIRTGSAIWAWLVRTVRGTAWTLN